LIQYVQDTIGRHQVTLDELAGLNLEFIRRSARHPDVVLQDVPGAHSTLDSTGADDIRQYMSLDDLWKKNKQKLTLAVTS